MALQTSGQISIKDIADEFGDSAPHALSEFRGKGDIPASGQAKVSQAYGASNIYVASSLTDFPGATTIESGGKGIKWTNNGSWSFTVPDGIGSARIHVVGGGGGASGGGHGSGGGGGGAGGYKDVTLTAGSTYTITVGNNGTHGHCTASSGSSSSFGSLITAGGGSGGRGGQSGCGLYYYAPGGSISGHTAGSSGGSGGANHDTNCGTYHGGSGGSYGAGGGGASPGWGCGNGPTGNGGSGGGYGGNGGRAADHDGNGRQDGFAYGGGGGAGSYPSGAPGAKGVVILQWDTGITAAGAT